MTKYPEHEKLREIVKYSQTVGGFLDWLVGKGVHLASYHEHDEDCLDGRGEPTRCGMSEQRLYPYRYNTEKLLAEFFRINLKRLNEEKMAMLEEIRR